MINRSNLFLLISLLYVTSAFTQVKTLFQKPVEDKVKYTDSIIDPYKGIIMYAKLTYMLGGDSIRNCNGYACQSWLEDFYENGQMLHRGYYVDGQLKIYKNYYPDGTLERQFKNVDLYKCELITNYPNGQNRTVGLYVDGSALKYEEYNPDGTLSYYEEYHKSMDYYISNKSYFENGKPESILLLTNPKKLEFSKKEYYENGNLKEEGTLFFDKSNFDYYKSDKWLFYNEDGKLANESFYENGKKIKENNY